MEISTREDEQERTERERTKRTNPSDIMNEKEDRTKRKNPSDVKNEKEDRTKEKKNETYMMDQCGRSTPSNRYQVKFKQLEKKCYIIFLRD